MKLRKGFVSIVVTMMLLLIFVGFFIYMQSWFVDYKSEMGVKTRKGDFDDEFEVEKIEGTYVYFNNEFRDDVTIEGVSIGGEECYIENLHIEKGFGKFDIGGCTMNLNNSIAYDVMVLTDDGVKNEVEMIREPVDNLLVVEEEFGACDLSSGYVRLYGLSDTDNAHADIDGSYTYSICVRHLDYTLGTSSSGNFANLFYLTEKNNSAIWTNKSSIYDSPDNWFNVSISSSGGTIDYAINSSDMSSKNYVCVGTIDEDNVFGSHIGDCDSSMPDKIWLRIV